MHPTGNSKASSVDAIVQNQLNRKDPRDALGSKLACSVINRQYPKIDRGHYLRWINKTACGHTDLGQTDSQTDNCWRCMGPVPGTPRGNSWDGTSVHACMSPLCLLMSTQQKAGVVLQY
jgi:hypothetical protein